MCQKSSASAGVRSYVLNNYESLKASNPDFPFIVREAIGAQPCVTARYEFGVERRVYVNEASESEVAATIDELVSDAESINSAAANSTRL